MNILHVHSMYSLNDCASTADDICARAKELGAESVTLTDHGTLLGIDDFTEAGKKYGINAIPGVEAYAADRAHLIIVAKNYDGFKAISYAMKEANEHIENVRKRTYPIMTDEILEKYFRGNKNVIATTACVQGPVGLILQNNYRIGRKAAKYQAIADKNKEASKAYLNAQSEKERLADCLRKRKAQLKADSKYTKPTFLKKIASMENKSVEMINGTEQKEKLFAELSALKAQNETAVKMVEEHNRAIRNMEAELRSARQAANKNKAGHDKYENALEKAEEILKGMKTDQELYDEAKDRLMYLKGIFPNFYVELQYHGVPSESLVMPILLELADETETPIIASNDAHLVTSSEADAEARRILRFNFFFRSEKTVCSDRELYIKTDEELTEALSKIIPEERAKEAVANTAVLSECKVVFPNEKHYPKTSDGVTIDDLINKAVLERKEAGLWSDVYQERLDHELPIIKQMGFEDYFLVVCNFCRVARRLGVVPKSRQNEIRLDFSRTDKWIAEEGFRDGVGAGPGRGSAAGSLVCYLLGITNIDPIKYDLLFERFLNPERVTMPDIDTDVPRNLRYHVINYIREYYGENAVCSIATIMVYGAKSAIKMVGRDRANELFQNTQDADIKIREYQNQITYPLADMIPQKPGITLADCEDNVEDTVKYNPEMKLVWERSKLIEGVAYGTGIHAGGIIISDNDNINDYVPLAWNEEKGVWVAQCDMVRAEEKGLLKMDILGVNTLDIISETVQLAARNYGEHIDLNNLPIDAEVFSEIYSKGNTNNVFQFESPGMKKMLRRFKPTSIKDLIILVATYRPGPMQYLDNIIEVKNGSKKPSYKIPELSSVLSETYGAIIYQEQVMQIFQKLAGYSLGNADLVRRAMGKKKMEKLAREREAFVHGDKDRNIVGCEANGISAEDAEELFDEMLNFAQYAFNKSHAAAYAVLSYQTAWLKYHYPAEFCCAMFNNVEQEKYSAIISDCEETGVELRQLNINESFFDFVLEENNVNSANNNASYAIRYGLRGIKGIGSENRSTFDRIISERGKNGPYSTVKDFLIRTAGKDEADRYKTIQKKVFILLAESGIFDCTGQSREDIIDAFPNQITETSYERLKNKISDTNIEVHEPDKTYNNSMELKNLGSVISSRPLIKYKSASVYGCVEISDLDGRDNELVSIFGILSDCKESKTRKNGKRMMTLRIHGKSGNCDVLVFDPAYESYQTFIRKSLYKVVRITGTVKGSSVTLRTIEEMSANEMVMVVAGTLSYDDLTFISSLGRNETSNPDNPIKVVIMYWTNKRGEKKVGNEVRWFTQKAVNACLGHGIKFVDPDHPDV